MIKQVPDKAYFVEMIYQLWKSYPTYRGDSKFQSWMYRVALNTAMLGLRARKMKYTGISTKNVSEKTLKGNRNINFNLLFYGAIQVANIILLSMNLAGYMNNPAMKWILIPQLVITIGILVFGIDVFYKFREINNYSDSLQKLIQKQLWFYRKPYELWLVLASVSAIILISNLNLYVDNDNGSYVINNKAMFVGVSLMAFLLIYGTQKATSMMGLRKLKAYLSDLQQGVLDSSEQMERSKRRYLWLWVAVFLLLTASLVFGILTALK